MGVEILMHVDLNVVVGCSLVALPGVCILKKTQLKEYVCTVLCEQKLGGPVKNLQEASAYLLVSTSFLGVSVWGCLLQANINHVGI